jgi:hypothetical protein
MFKLPLLHGQVALLIWYVKNIFGVYHYLFDVTYIFKIFDFDYLKDSWLI